MCTNWKFRRTEGQRRKDPRIEETEVPTVGNRLENGSN
jgi:hypothetical protein